LRFKLLPFSCNGVFEQHGTKVQINHQ